MSRHGKKHIDISKKLSGEVYELDNAVQFLRENPAAKFDESVELAVRTGVDTAKSDQSVRGTVSLPFGTGKKVRVAVFANGPAAEAATAAGADHVGFEDLIEKVKGGWLDFDVAVATPEAMKELRKLGKILGPRGLMPNPKTGTVTDDTASAVTQCKAGRVEFRMDKNGNVQLPIGKLSFAVESLVGNANTALDAIRAQRPSSLKGPFFKSCTLSSTMGVGLRVNVQG
ncbi:MAG: 50S ribosomal protein L1 [Lentisphaerales bacterium]|jgi:large subunit ribosomal protein L1|nr:MAG: 50S ribosomal protein L1 [Lentisphaerales bacterium]